MITSELVAKLKDELTKVVVGQPELCHMLCVCLVAGGHVLIEGAPGLGKTLAARSLAKAADVPFKRVQFTPDLMPSDILGTNVFDNTTGKFTLNKGPIFTGFLLADEINRTPPKTQSALLEAMEEGKVTIDGVVYNLPAHFMVFATQNPIEYEGTYPLPEAQLDRFMMKLTVGYPLRVEEQRLLNNVLNGFDAHEIAEITQCLTDADIATARATARAVRVEASLLGYLMDILEATRQDHHIFLGASPRAGVSILAAARANALIDDRDFCVPEDFQVIIRPSLRHRLILTPDAEIEGFSSDAILERVLNQVTVPR